MLSWVVSVQTVTEGDRVKVISGNSHYLKIGLYRGNIGKPVFLSPFVTGQPCPAHPSLAAINLQALPPLFPVHHAILHDEADVLQRGDILQRVPVYRDHIGVEARLELADQILLAEKARSV